MTRYALRRISDGYFYAGHDKGGLDRWTSTISVPHTFASMTEATIEGFALDLHADEWAIKPIEQQDDPNV
jgi:hypothetical protein